MTTINTLKFESETCTRCGGTGFIPAFAGIHGGQCFGCAGAGQKLTPAGRSAKRLFEELMDAASERIPAWQVEVGQTVSYVGQRRWFTVLEKDFSSTSGSVIDGHAASAVLKSRRAHHMVYPTTDMAVRPALAKRIEIMREVDKRRKGATLVSEEKEVSAS